MARLSCDDSGEQLAGRTGKGTCQMVGLAIAVILGIIALRAMAAAAGVGLHKGVQMAEIVGDWHKLSTELWTG